MAKGGCSKEQPPFLTNEAEKGRGAICPAPLKVSLFTFRCFAVIFPDAAA